MRSFAVVEKHIWVYKIFGLWPPDHPSAWYSLFSALAIGLVYVGFPVTLGASVMFVDSMNRVVDNLVMTSSLVMAGVKGINVFLNKSNLKELFKMLDYLDSRIKTKAEEQTFEPIFDECHKLLKMFMTAYLVAWSCLTLQIFWSDTDQILWSSTLFYPFESLKTPPIYFSVLVFQCFSNFCICVVDASADTYGVVLNHILGGHIDVLGSRLRNLGYNDNVKKSTEQELALNKELIECVKTYEVCIRYAFTI